MPKLDAKKSAGKAVIGPYLVGQISIALVGVQGVRAVQMAKFSRKHTISIT